MGTNYYMIENVCECCGRGDKKTHIGKSSGGWCFSLHIDINEGLLNLGDWKKRLSSHNVIVKDEYGTVITLPELFDIIENRSWESKFSKKPYGYNSWEQFHLLNHSEPGPKNLLRHKVDGKHCVGQGEGTYDYIAGEFC